APPSSLALDDLLCKLFQEQNLARRLDSAFFDLSNSANRRLGVLALGNQIDGQHRPGSAEARFAVNSDGSLDFALRVHKPHEFQRLLLRGCGTIGNGKA